jgi:hypothetical protein
MPRRPPATLKAFEELMTELGFQVNLAGDWVDAITDVFNEDNNTYARLVFDCEFKPDPKFSVSIAPDAWGDTPTPKEIAQYLHSWLRVAAVFLTTDEPFTLVEKPPRKKSAR